MKKKVLFVAALFTATFGMAQDLTSKKGEAILPEAGDYAIGFNASPFIGYFGNMLNNSTNNGMAANFIGGDQAIMGKMFTDANNAYRFGLRVGLNTSSNTTLVGEIDNAGAQSAEDFVENVAKTSSFNLVLSAGKEMRRGSTRLQGFYGAEAMIGLGSMSTENEYGNDIENVFLFDGTTSRQTSTSAGTTFGIGARGFVGVEYFVAAKISIAAEYGWGLMLNTTGNGESVTEEYDAGTDKTSTETMETGGNSSFSLDTDVSGGALRVMFHF